MYYNYACTSWFLFLFLSLSRADGLVPPACLASSADPTWRYLGVSLQPNYCLPFVSFFCCSVSPVCSRFFFSFLLLRLCFSPPLSPPLPFASSPEIRQLAALHAHDHMAWLDAKRMSHHDSASPRARPRGRPTSPMAFREATWAGKERIWMERPVLFSPSLSPSFLSPLWYLLFSADVEQPHPPTRNPVRYVSTGCAST